MAGEYDDADHDAAVAQSCRRPGETLLDLAAEAGKPIAHSVAGFGGLFSGVLTVTLFSALMPTAAGVYQINGTVPPYPRSGLSFR